MARFIENLEEFNRGYDNDSYISFLSDEKNELPWEWYSIQLEMVQMSIYAKILCELIDITKEDKWLLTHDYDGFPWLPFEEENHLLPTLNGLFKENNISNRFVGGIELSTKELKSLALDIVSYSSLLEYHEINVSSLCSPILFKMSGHKNIDLISHDKKMSSFLLKKLDIDAEYKVVKY